MQTLLDSMSSWVCRKHHFYSQWLTGVSGIVTHKGASADSGHYIGFVRADVVQKVEGPINYDEDRDQWIKFDDDKVCIVSLSPWRALTDGRPGLNAHGGKSWSVGRRRRRICGLYPSVSFQADLVRLCIRVNTLAIGI